MITTMRDGERQQRECVPSPADLWPLVESKSSQLLLIWAEGGAGKTSLAFEIALWGLEEKLAPHPLLPCFLERLADPAEEATLTERLAAYFNTRTGSSLTSKQVEELLSHRRLLLIVDHFSELNPDQQRWIQNNLPPQPCLLLLTSRLREHHQTFKNKGWMIMEIQPQRLKGAELLDFFHAYLHERWQKETTDKQVPLLSAVDQTRTQELLERMVGNQPITVLLAWMVIEKAIQHINDRKVKLKDGPVDLLPSSVPELMEEYVKTRAESIAMESRWFQTYPEQEPEQMLIFLKALALAAHRQGAHHPRYQPQNFNEQLAFSAWAEELVDNKPLQPAQKRALLIYIKDKLTLLTFDQSAGYRLALDPLADYLAALAQQERWRRQQESDPQRKPLEHDSITHRKVVERWLNEQWGRRQNPFTENEAELDPLSGMRGFLAACRDCYRQWLNQHQESLDATERKQWENLLDFFAHAAKIDKLEERILTVRHLIRRHADDLEWANPELRAKAIAALIAYAREFKTITQPADSAKEFAGVRELDPALGPLQSTMAKTSYPEADRAAAAEALGHIGGQRAAAALLAVITSANEPVTLRRAAASALGLVDASPEELNVHWNALKAILSDEANHLRGEFDDNTKLPLLQGASRGLQRLAARSTPPFLLPDWGAQSGLVVPMLTLTTSNQAVTTRLVEVEVWQLPLPGGLPLEVVRIPAGTYKLGSPSGEWGRDVYGLTQVVRPEEAERVEALRTLTVPSFALARYPLTQAQWATLAGPEHRLDLEDSPNVLGDALELEPAKQRGPELPVESVSWRQASAWCLRLQRHLSTQLGDRAPRVGLPSESLWELACRASSPTPFHFGDSLDAAWANYDANDAYPPGKPGPYPNQLTPVGAYGLVNAFGLADLHGNVWEWCADAWHPDPSGAPRDGSPRTDPAVGLLETRLLRGGSWFNRPRFCRSAYRLRGHQDGRYDYVGFRLCVFPPGLPSWSLSP
ncbi:MAG: SUMF1/EgtB/PvdO family nonheme iron enzyme [Cyanobacteriota bacterium]